MKTLSILTLSTTLSLLALYATGCASHPYWEDKDQDYDHRNDRWEHSDNSNTMNRDSTSDDWQPAQSASRARTGSMNTYDNKTDKSSYQDTSYQGNTMGNSSMNGSTGSYNADASAYQNNHNGNYTYSGPHATTRPGYSYSSGPNNANSIYNNNNNTNQGMTESGRTMMGNTQP